MKSGGGNERAPGLTGDEMGGGQGPDQEGSCEEGQGVTKGLKQGGACMRKVPGWSGRAWKKLGAARQAGGCCSDQGSTVALRTQGSGGFGRQSAGTGLDLRADGHRG